MLLKGNIKILNAKPNKNIKMTILVFVIFYYYKLLYCKCHKKKLVTTRKVYTVLS